MEVYEFEKSLLTRLQETSDVLCARGIALPASEVRTEWANYVEIAIEPTGWQAQWRIPRVLCEELGLRFPTVVVGTVEQVLFEELKAILVVEAVQDDDVHMPERQVVSLEELWPLKQQENDALNVDRTADCLDRLRFFYQHVWMPWDNDEDDDGSDWAEKNLYDRVKFYYDVKKRVLSKRLVSHVLSLLAEANYVQKKRELLEMEAEAEEEENESEGETDPEDKRTSKLVELHLRLNVIKNEMKILEDPTLREAFEKVRFGLPAEKQTSDEASVVVHTGTLDQHIAYLNEAKAIIGNSKTVRLCDSLQGALDRCSSNELYLPPGTHAIKFLEYLNGGGLLKAVSAVRFADACRAGQLHAIKGEAIISSKDDDSVLLTVDGDYCFENIMLDCVNVRTGVLIKQGNVTFKNCCLIGDAQSSTKQGIVVFGNSRITLQNCVLKDFSTGIYANENCQICLSDSVILECTRGLEIPCGGSANFRSTEIRNCKSYGVLLEVDDLNASQGGGEETRLLLNDHNAIGRSELSFEGNCNFRENGKANFIISKSGTGKFNNSCFVDQATPSNVSNRVCSDESDMVVKDDPDGTHLDDYKGQLDDVGKQLWGAYQTNGNGGKLDGSKYNGCDSSTDNDGTDLYSTVNDRSECTTSCTSSSSAMLEASAVIEIDESVIEID